MVHVIIMYLHSGKQRLWREEGASGPACWRQAGLGTPFLLAWLASERVLPSEATDAPIPLGIAHQTPSPTYWLTPHSSPGPGYAQGDTHSSFGPILPSCLSGVHVQNTNQERVNEHENAHGVPVRTIRNNFHRALYRGRLAPASGHCRHLLCGHQRP